MSQPVAPAQAGDRQRIDASRAHAAMLLFALLISASFPIGEAITFGLDPVLVTFFRFLFGSVILAIVVSLKHQWRIPAPRDLVRYAALSLPTVIFFILMFEALRHTTAVNTAAIFTLLPAMTALLSIVIVAQAMRAVQWLAMGVGALGAAWIVFGGSLDRMLAFSLGKGELIQFIGCVSYATYSPLVRKLHRGEPMAVYCFFLLAASAAVTGAFAVLAGRGADLAAIAPGVWAGIAYLAVFSTASSFFLSQYASLRLPSAKVMAYTYLIPCFVLAINAAIGKGWPSISVMAGALVVASATFMLQKS